ncbi:glutamate--tRNA ligase [Frankia sp. CiP3]|uniref:glutamate--tRNA ligase n=1 Tax=Frankia sp. CiP3 TaxID=2880971 RepID=UPI001EF4503A|nr:glutamate--tRNA ligase [Frankia sp. CiP3]
MVSVVPRLRFAPSPTGLFHVGNARSLLLNWVVARQSGGSLVLRIEDTDAARSRPEWTQGIIDAMAWLGVGPAEYEGPYLQSANAEAHAAAVQGLLSAGRAYFCDCSREDVIARTGDSHRGYDGFCRDRGLVERRDTSTTPASPAALGGQGRAVRFRTPDDGTTIVVDLVRGKPAFENALLEDFIIARSDLSATFLLANVVDDMTMGITHVIRAEEHLSNAPKQQLLWEAMGAPPPVWAHTPILVNAKRQKLSKRRDRVALEDFRAEGYLAAAMRNYLMLLGWAPSGDREIVPWEVIETEFRLTEVNSAPAYFDVTKLRAFNGEYIRALSHEEFIAACAPWLTGPSAPWDADAYDPAVFAAVAPLAQTRLVLLSEILELVDFLFLDEPAIDEAAWAKAMKDGAAALLTATIDAYSPLAGGPEWDAATLKARLEDVAVAHGLKLGKAQAPVRVAVTGRSVGLPLFESVAVLGPDRTLARLRAAHTRLT